MGNLVDEFDFLIDHSEDNTTFVDDSNKLINSANIFLEKANKYPDETYQGIKLSDIASCITIDKSEIYSEKHVIFTINTHILRDTNNENIKEFTIPPFVEEVQGIGNKDGTEFGFNQSHRNFIKTIVVSKEVKIIAPYAFALYKKLENIIFEKDSKLIYVGFGAFDCCEKLKSLDLRNCEELDILQDGALDGSGIQVLKVTEHFRSPGKCNNISINTVYRGKIKVTI